jgi:hypothetical protein
MLLLVLHLEYTRFWYRLARDQKYKQRKTKKNHEDMLAKNNAQEEEAWLKVAVYFSATDAW